MVGKIKNGSHFRGLITYITDPEKQEWKEGRNLHKLDRNTVIKDMEFVAGLSEKVQEPVYHVSVSWSPQDAPSKEEMIEVADRVLKELGLEKNQALIVSHKDTDHPHIHLAINRVDPEQFKAVDRWKHKMTLRETLRQIEKEKGWTKTAPAGRGQADIIKADWQDKHRVTLNKALAGMGIDNPNYQTVRERALQMRDDLFKQNGWKGFDNTLAKKGLWVENKGHGMVITDGSLRMKASSLAREFSRGKLEKKFGQPLEQYLDRRELSIDVKKGVATIVDWMKAKQRLELESAKIGIEKALQTVHREAWKIDKFDRTINERKRAIDEGFDKTFSDPKEAKRDFAIIVERDGLDKAHAELVANPRTFGRVKDEQELLSISKNIQELEQVYDSWRGFLEDKIIKDERMRASKRKNLEGREIRLKKSLPVIKRELHKAMRQSEAGHTVSRTAQEVIAVSRAVTLIMKNYQPLAKKLGSRGLNAFKKDLVEQSEAGKAIVQMGDQAVKATHLVLKLGAAMHSGGMSMAQSGIRHAVHQHHQNKLQKQRERELSRGDFSR